MEHGGPLSAIERGLGTPQDTHNSFISILAAARWLGLLSLPHRWGGVTSLEWEAGKQARPNTTGDGVSRGCVGNSGRPSDGPNFNGQKLSGPLAQWTTDAFRLRLLRPNNRYAKRHLPTLKNASLLRHRRHLETSETNAAGSGQASLAEPSQPASRVLSR